MEYLSTIYCGKRRLPKGRQLKQVCICRRRAILRNDVRLVRNERLVSGLNRNGNVLNHTGATPAGIIGVSRNMPERKRQRNNNFCLLQN